MANKEIERDRQTRVAVKSYDNQRNMYTDRKNDRLKNREKRVKNITKRTILKYRKTTFKV